MRAAQTYSHGTWTSIQMLALAQPAIPVDETSCLTKRPRMAKEGDGKEGPRLARR
jgi:hypothetical protein